MLLILCCYFPEGGFFFFFWSVSGELLQVGFSLQLDSTFTASASFQTLLQGPKVSPIHQEMHDIQQSAAYGGKSASRANPRVGGGGGGARAANMPCDLQSVVLSEIWWSKQIGSWVLSNQQPWKHSSVDGEGGKVHLPWLVFTSIIQISFSLSCFMFRSQM